MRYPTTLRTSLAEIYCVPTSFAAFSYATPATDTGDTTLGGGGMSGRGGISGKGISTKGGVSGRGVCVGGRGGTTGTLPLPQDVYIPPPALELFYLVSRFELGKLSVRDRQFLTKVHHNTTPHCITPTTHHTTHNNNHQQMNPMFRYTIYPPTHTLPRPF